MMLTKHTIKEIVASFLLRNSIDITVLLGVSGMLTGVGMLIADIANRELNQLLQVAPSTLWGCMFLVYGTIKLVSILPIRLLPERLLAYVSVQGIWLWTYIMLGSTMFDPRPLSPGELLIILPLICETWSLVYTLTRKRSS